MKKKFTPFLYAGIFIFLSAALACSQRVVDSAPAGANTIAEATQSPAPEATLAPLLTKPTGFVNDYAGVLDSETKNRLETVFAKLQSQAKIDFAVATVKSTGGHSIFDYSLSVAKEWKIGSENGGLLLVVAVEDRKWHIQIDKRLEKDLTNDEVKQVGDLMIDDFKKKEYGKGVVKCVEKMISILSKKQGFEPPKV